MSLYKRGNVWWCKFKIEGQIERRSCNTGDREIAERFEQVAKAKYKANLRYLEKGKVGLAQLGALDVARARRAHCLENSIATCTILHWKHLISFFEPGASDSFDPATITLQDIERYQDHRIAQGVKSQTYARELVTLKRGLQLGASNYHFVMPIQEYEWPKIKAQPKNEAMKGQLYEWPVIKDFLSRLEGECLNQYVIAAWTALRLTELLNIKPEWITREATPTASLAGILRLPDWATKGKRKREVALSPEAMAAVDAQLKIRADVPELGALGPRKGFLFSGRDYRKALHRASRAMGLELPITARDLRHSFMTTGLENGADLKALMEAGGHKTLAAAELYQSTTRARTINVMEAAIRGKRPQGAQQRGHSESAQTA